MGGEGVRQKSALLGRSETAMKKYNPINLYVAAKVKPQEKEVKEGLNQAKKLLEAMTSALEQQSDIVTEALQQLGQLEWDVLNQTKIILDEIRHSNKFPNEILAAGDFGKLNTAIQRVFCAYEKMPQPLGALLPIFASLGFARTVIEAAAALDSEHDTSDPTKVILDRLNIKLNEKGEIPSIGTGCLSFEESGASYTYKALWPTVLPIVTPITPLTPTFPAIEKLNEHQKKCVRLHMKIYNAQITLRKIATLHGKILAHSEYLRDISSQFDGAMKRFTVSESQTDMLQGVVLGTLLYNLCDKPLLVKTSSGGYDV